MHNCHLTASSFNSALSLLVQNDVTVSFSTLHRTIGAAVAFLLCRQFNQRSSPG
jgi:hypothetical protein